MRTALRTLTVPLLLVCAAVYLLPVPADSGKSEPASPSAGNSCASALRDECPTIYGVSSRGLTVTRGMVHKGQTLVDLLSGYDVPYGRILEAAEACKGVFDLRRLRPGQRVCVLGAADGNLRHFVYERSLLDYVRFDFDDPIRVSVGHKQAETRLRQAAATVSTSLWQSLHDQGVGSEVIVQLDEVFGQAVDLFRLQPGDAVRLVYEEIWIEGRRVDTGRIQAARLDHDGRRINAFYFEDGKGRGYFDELGRSLQRTFLRAPLRYTRISSGFSHRRLHPILKIYRPHHAIDYAAPVGTPVLAIGSGTVLRTGRNREAGRFIRLRHGSRYESRYIHLSRLARGMHRGRQVARGDVIGYVGQTGLATGPHLDFAFYRNGAPVNFRRLEFPRGTPVSAARMPAFQDRVARLHARLKMAAPAVATAAASPTADPGV